MPIAPSVKPSRTKAPRPMRIALWGGVAKRPDTGAVCRLARPDTDNERPRARRYSCPTARDSGSCMALMRASASLQAVPVDTSASAAASTAFKVARRVSRDFAARFSARLCASTRCSPSAATVFSIPSAFASAALNGRQVRTSSRVAAGPISRTSRWIPPQASGMPRSTSGIETRGLGGDPQIACGRQHHTAADTVPVDGCDRDRLHRLDRLRHLASGVGCIAGRVPAGSPKLARSAPALKARPAPCTITTRTSSRASNQSAAATSSAGMWSTTGSAALAGSIGCGRSCRRPTRPGS